MNRIKEYRMKARMTQSDLSAYLEIPTRTIEDWEAGKRNPAPVSYTQMTLPTKA